MIVSLTGLASVELARAAPAEAIRLLNEARAHAGEGLAINFGEMISISLGRALALAASSTPLAPNWNTGSRWPNGSVSATTTPRATSSSASWPGGRATWAGLASSSTAPCRSSTQPAAAGHDRDGRDGLQPGGLPG